jgi:FkbM family methyltransferase
MTTFQAIRYMLRLAVGAIVHLKNWPELLSGSRREARGEAVPETPVLRFRDGLELELVPGGYGGFYVLFPEIWLRKCYEPTPEFTIRAGYTVVDLGANMGFFTCKTARAAANVRVLAVEPVSVYVERLRSNVLRNGIENVTVVQAAATGTSGSAITINIWYKPSGEPMVLAEIPKDADRVEQEVVPGLTLPEIFSRGDIDRCDLLKVDIEGAEFELFANLPKETWGRIRRVVMEVHHVRGHAPAELGDLFRTHGFEVTMQPSFDTVMMWAVKKAA